MKEKSKGGARKGAGRKPTADPKLPVTIFVETSIIESMGGKEAIQLCCYSAIYDKNFPDISLLVAKETISVPGAKKQDIAARAPVTRLKPQKQPESNWSANARPKTLDELKRLCPAELTGLNRSEWISKERQKYGI